jgi:L-ribulose-5-phosphate 3-epimerase
MKRFKIGVMSDCFRLGVKGGMRKAAEMCADGLQVYTVAGELSPGELDKAKRTEYKAFIADLGLEISALCGDCGAGFANPETNPSTIELSKQVVDLAADWDTRVVTTHIGTVPEDASCETYQIMLAACKEIADYGAKAGVTLAVETGPETAVLLKRFLDDVGSKGLGVNLDPANLVMCVADDPVRAVHTLKDYIVHTHAKDGVQLRQVTDDEISQGAMAAELGPLFEELPLGKGGVDWDAYLAALEAIGFNGYLTIEREVGDSPEKDIAEAVDFLRGKIREQ